jgi:ankyrin repeat protein
VTHESAFWGQPEMLEFLLTEAKVDPNLRSKNGQTALHYAMWNMVNGKDEFNKPYLKCIQLLLKHGTNPDLRGGNNNRTPLEMALNNGLSDVVALLEAQ